jgi:hypothetical protein
MVKFGLYEGGSKPTQEYEGEWLEVSGDMVSVVAHSDKGIQHTFAVIRLAPGHCVKKIN